MSERTWQEKVERNRLLKLYLKAQMRSHALGWRVSTNEGGPMGRTMAVMCLRAAVRARQDLRKRSV
jgi:hypothetical protein